MAKKTSLVVSGDPVPQPRPRVTLRGGKARGYVPGDHPIHAYREKIATAAKQQNIGVLAGPVVITCLFVFARKKSHLTKSGLAKGAPQFPPPDCDNLIKGVLDALNGVAFVDDSQVVKIGVAKEYAQPGEVGYTGLRIETAT